jgi:hypothetical protein
MSFVSVSEGKSAVPVGGMNPPPEPPDPLDEDDDDEDEFDEFDELDADDEEDEEEFEPEDELELPPVPPVCPSPPAPLEPPSPPEPLMVDPPVAQPWIEMNVVGNVNASIRAERAMASKRLGSVMRGIIDIFSF